MASGQNNEGLALRSPKGRVALVAAVAASGMAMLDATVVNVALPHIGREFGANVAALQWVLTGYLITLASLILVGGALGDRLGRRRVFIIGCGSFAAASLLCGAAPNIEVLVGARMLQGVGGALLTPGSLAILQASIQPQDRAAAVGAWSGLSGVAAAVGPFVGGALVGGPGWRWAFLLNVPVAVLVIVSARAAVPESRDENASRRMDLISAGLAMAGLAASTWVLTEGATRGWTDELVIVLGVLAVGSLAGFVWRTLRARDPLVPPALFRDRTFTVMNLATVLLYAAIGVTFFLVTYEMQVAAGRSPLQAGAALLPVTVLMLLLSRASGALAQRIGPRTQLTIGPLLAGAGLLLLMRIGPHASWVSDVLPGAFVFGLGLACFVAPLTATVMAAVDPAHVSIASGVNNAIARAASLAALAVIPVVSGLTTANGAGEITASFRTSMFISGLIAASAAPLVFFTLRSLPETSRAERRLHCAVEAPPA
jgi:EmrB/QacA subfamily drug resistance transporter